MATVKQPLGARSGLTVTGLSTLAAGTYVGSTAYNCNTNQPMDVAVEVNATTTNTPAGNKQVCVFIQESLDGTNFRSGPSAGTTTTDEPDLLLLGVVPVNTSGGNHMRTFSVAQALGYVPYAFKVVLKNDLGVALTGGSVFTSEISDTVA